MSNGHAPTGLTSSRTTLKRRFSGLEQRWTTRAFSLTRRRRLPRPFHDAHSTNARNPLDHGSYRIGLYMAESPCPPPRHNGRKGVVRFLWGKAWTMRPRRSKDRLASVRDSFIAHDDSYGRVTPHGTGHRETESPSATTCQPVRRRYWNRPAPRDNVPAQSPILGGCKSGPLGSRQGAIIKTLRDGGSHATNEADNRHAGAPRQRRGRTSNRAALGW